MSALPSGAFHGETVRLDPLGDEHAGLCHHLVTLPEAHWPRLYRTDPNMVLTRLWADALAPFVIIGPDGPIGVASVHSPVERHSYASFEVIGLPGTDDLALEEAARLIVHHVGFGVFNYRKLYHLHYGHQPGRLKDEAVEEVRLTDHTLIGGTYWDRVTDAVYRTAPTDHDIEPPKRTGSLRRFDVRLRPVLPTDHARLRAIELSERNLVRWRYAGQIPPPPLMVTMRDAGVADQAVIVLGDDDDRTAQGLVNVHSVDLDSGTGWVAVVTADEYHHTGLGLLGVVLFIDRTFETFPMMRKLYAEVNEANLADFASVVRRGYATTQGVLRDHVLFGGEPFDTHTLCIDRQGWLERVRPRLARFRKGTS